MRVVLVMSLALGACYHRTGVHVYGAPHVHIHSDENVDQKRREWFDGLYRDCVHGNQAMACYKTGDNVEHGVVVPPNIDDAHWFYARACDLEPHEMYCVAADRTAPE